MGGKSSKRSSSSLKTADKQNQKPSRLHIQVIGSRYAGKTALVYQVKYGNMDDFEGFIGIGIDFQIVNVSDEKIALWDIATRERSRSIEHYHFRGKDGFVFVIDSSSETEVDDSLCLFKDYILKCDVMEDKILMVLANKQDLEGAVPVADIEGKLERVLSDLGPDLGGRTVFLRGCSAKTGQGVQEAFSYLLGVIRQQKEGRLAPGFIALPYQHENCDGQEDVISEVGDKETGKDENDTKLNYLMKMYDTTVPSVKSVLVY